LIHAYVSTYRIEKIRHTSDLKATDIVGNDIGAAYDFGQIGLIVTDDAGRILWLNNLLSERGVNLVDYSISDLSPKLYEMMMYKEKSGNEVVHIRYNNKFYDAEYIKEANLFILRDTTNYESLVAFNVSHASVIGYLNIDNFSDVHTADELQRTEIESAIRKTILDYFRKYNCLLKPIKMDSYLLILTKEDLDRMRDDRFSIIPSFAKEFEQDGLTCSLGFGYGFLDYNQNNELASSSLDVALSRGGNQCVVAPSGENMLFFGGGNTESQSSTSKVRIKTFARSLVMAIQSSPNILIVMHDNADMDAVGAALGVFSICKAVNKKGQKVNIIYDSQHVERAADAALRQSLPTDFFSNVFVSFAGADELKTRDTLIIVVDHSRPTISIYPDLYKGGDTPKIAVIDHHRKQDDSFKNPLFEHIDSSASSTCELIAQYFDSLPYKTNVSEEIATIMLSGIYLDTQSFAVKTRILTHESAIILAQMGADEAKAHDFLKEDFESFFIKSKILANVETYSYGVLIAKAPQEEFVNPAILASVCNELTGIDSVQACFSIGRISESTVYISARGNGKVNCEILMMKLGGGGHFSAGAAALKETTVERGLAKLKHILDEYLKDASTAPEPEDKGE
jgi:c-di-AMP phosphodiesterase-like protein